jgi:hypothetical protein
LIWGESQQIHLAEDWLQRLTTEGDNLDVTNLGHQLTKATQDLNLTLSRRLLFPKATVRIIKPSNQEEPHPLTAEITGDVSPVIGRGITHQLFPQGLASTAIGEPEVPATFLGLLSLASPNPQANSTKRLLALGIDLPPFDNTFNLLPAEVKDPLISTYTPIVKLLQRFFSTGLTTHN